MMGDNAMDDNFTGVKKRTVYNNGKPVAEISNRMTADFSKGANKGNAPKSQDIENMIKSIIKKEGE